MEQFWEERKKDLKQINARRARELAAKHFSMVCPVRFAAAMFPGIKLLACQKKALCIMAGHRSSRWEYIQMPKRHGRNTLARLLTAYTAQAQGAAI